MTLLNPRKRNPPSRRAVRPPKHDGNPGGCSPNCPACKFWKAGGVGPITHTCVDNNHAGCAACEAGETAMRRRNKTHKRNQAS